jgi:hypothetical protein
MAKTYRKYTHKDKVYQEGRKNERKAHQEVETRYKSKGFCPRDKYFWVEEEIELEENEHQT